MHKYTHTHICIQSFSSSFKKVMGLRLGQKILQ